MKVASVADVRSHFSAYLKASEQAPVVVTRNGKPVAMLVAVDDPDEVERLLLAHSPRLQAILEAARRRIAAGEGIPEEEFWAHVESHKSAGKQGSRRGKSA